MVTHEQAAAEKAERVIKIRDGRVVIDSSPDNQDYASH
jgi:ABC-type lipoprotein export system ATPase subunit